MAQCSLAIFFRVSIPIHTHTQDFQTNMIILISLENKFFHVLANETIDLDLLCDREIIWEFETSHFLKEMSGNLNQNTQTWQTHR